MTTIAVAHALNGLLNSPQNDYDRCLLITATLGPLRTIHMMNEAVKIGLSPDCPMIKDGSRKREVGGIFYQMLHSSKHIHPTEHVIIFRTMKGFF